MAAATATDAGKARKALFAACRELGIDDETRKQIQLRVVGKDSTSGMSAGEIGLVLDELKQSHGWTPKRQPKRAGARPIAPGDQAAKIRALWLALYHLAEIEDPTEAAIDGFARRMTKNAPGRGGAGVDSLRWLDAAAANQVIKALRGWCDRVGFVQPDAAAKRQIDAWRAHAGAEIAPTGFTEKVVLIKVQWRLLAERTTGIEKAEKLEVWLLRKYGAAAPALLSPQQADHAIEQLGTWLRKTKARSP